MTAIDVLDEARAAGLTLEVRGDRLAVRGKVTPELRGKLLAEKSAVLAILRFPERQREVLALWTAAHERRRTACPDWPEGGYRRLAAMAPHLDAVIAAAERDADQATDSFRAGAASVDALRAAVRAWLDAHEAAHRWLASRDGRPGGAL